MSTLVNGETITQSRYWTYTSTPKVSHAPLESLLFSLPHSAIPSLLSVLYTSLLVCISYKFILMESLGTDSFVWLLKLSIIILRFIQVSTVLSFLWLSSSIPLCAYTTICLLLQLLTDIWVVSSFGLLQIKLLWTFM